MKKTLFTFIIGIHLIFLSQLLFSSFSRVTQKKKKLVVNTCVVYSAISQPKAQASPAKKQGAAPAQITRAAPSVLPKKPPVKKSPAKQEATLNVPASLLRDLEETVAKMEGKKDQRKTSKKTLAPLVSLQIDEVSGEDDYLSGFTQLLRTSLHLPEFGEVKVALTLRQDGSFVTLKILQAESEKNRKYLEEHLPKLTFPHLRGSYAKQKENTFVLTFCNDAL